MESLNSFKGSVLSLIGPRRPGSGIGMSSNRIQGKHSLLRSDKVGVAPLRCARLRSVRARSPERRGCGGIGRGKRSPHRTLGVHSGRERMTMRHERHGASRLGASLDDAKAGPSYGVSWPSPRSAPFGWPLDGFPALDLPAPRPAAAAAPASAGSPGVTAGPRRNHAAILSRLSGVASTTLAFSDCFTAP